MIVAVFFFGLVVGSFLNAVIYRFSSNDSVFKGRSFCPDCRHKLVWIDLIPLISFFMVRGKCRYCGKKISWQYPLVEMATGIAFVLVSTSPFGGVELLFKLVFTSFLIVIFVYDLKHYLILDKIIIPAAFLALIYQIITGRVPQAVLGAVFLAGFFFFLYWASGGRWIGAGDIKLGIFLGLLVPVPETMVLFFLAYFFGALFALVLVARGRKKMKDSLPFGTFLTAAAFAAMLWGEKIVKIYLDLLL